MAISGKFTGDFTQFETAVDHAIVKLRGFETETDAVNKSLSNMVNKFSGVKLVEQATLMATAVEKIGGVTKLTANELQTVGRVAAEAAEKMRAMGGEPSARIAALAKAYEDLNEAQNSSISRIKE